MWIKISNPATKRLKDPTTGEFVAFTENGKAQVTKDVGQAMIETFDAITEVDN